MDAETAAGWTAIFEALDAEHLRTRIGNLEVSTIGILGLGGGSIRYRETMVFHDNGTTLDHYTRTCPTDGDFAAMHEAVVQKVGKNV
jgi:hypothetical protein